MYPNTLIRTPYHELPITIVNKAMRQKTYRQLHCLECGQPIADITDKIVVVIDGETVIEQLEPSRIGIVELHCPRHQCKQYYRMEFAI